MNKIVNSESRVVNSDKARITNHESRITKSGYTIVEMMLAMVVSSIVLAGAYATYYAVARQQTAQQAKSEVNGMGIPALQFIAKHVRMAGGVALDENMDPIVGSIGTPISITDSGDACCDQIEIIYDGADDERYQYIFFVLPRSSPLRNALYMDINSWTGSSWIAEEDNALVADYLDDFQAEVLQTGDSGQAKTIGLSMVIKSRTSLPETLSYTKPASILGNHTFSYTDNNYRDHFSITVSARNVK